jgi:hypothetical protein
MLRHRLNADDIYRTVLPDVADLRYFRELGLNAFNVLYLIPQHSALIPDVSVYTPELRQNLLDYPLLDWGVTTGKSTDEMWLQELHGDGLLVYPLQDGSIGSIRLANLRDGLEDYEYLWLLGKRDAALPVTTDLTHFTQDRATIYAQRDRIARQSSLARMRADF